MKILFTTTYYLPYISGLTVYVSRIGQGLLKRGYQINVLTSQDQKNLSSQENVNGINVKRVPYLWKISKGLIMPLYFWQALKAVANADVVVLNLPQFESFIPAFYAKILNKKLFCIYNCEVYLPKGIVNGLIERILLGASWLSIVMADKIIAYTKDYAEHSKLLPQVMRKVVFIYPPIPIPKIGQKTLLEDKPKYIIGVAARIAAEKGIEYLLEAIPILEKELGKDFLIVFAGSKDPVGEEKYLQKITPLFQKYKNYLKFLGTLPEEEMKSFYKLLDVLVLPSVNSTEAFGMVQVEAMLCGVPVVATDLPGVRVPIQVTGMGKIVPVEDKDKLAKAVAELLLNNKKYIKDKKIILNRFSLNKTLNFYQWLLQS